MVRVKIPPDVLIPSQDDSIQSLEVGFKTFLPFVIVWVIANRTERRNLLWLTLRKTGFYMEFCGPGHMHTSYHSDGHVHRQLEGHPEETDMQPPLPNITRPVLVQTGAATITDAALQDYDLTSFRYHTVDRVIYIDNRRLPESVTYQVWLVPPFKQAEVPLLTHVPAHVHLVTHTNPWIQVIIYEQGKRESAPRGQEPR